MPTPSPHAPAASTGQLAQYIPGHDPAPIIAAHEQILQDFLNAPVKDLLARLGLPSSAPETAAEDLPPAESPPSDSTAPASSMDPMGLISPVMDALGALGNGVFNGADPTAMFQGIADTFRGTGSSLQQSLGAVDNAWQGASGEAAAAKTVAAIRNGAEVGAQSDALRASLATAAAEVAQARTRLIEIITEFQATIAAIGPNIIFPWGWAAAIAAASKAITMTAEVMTELQSSLAAEAATISAVGAPVAVTAIPQLAASPLAGSVGQLVSMTSQAVMSGVQIGTGLASSASSATEAPPSDLAAPENGSADSAAPFGAAPVGGAGAAIGGGSGGPSGTPAPRSTTTSTMVQPESASNPTQSTTARTPGGASGMGMMGAPYAPMAGAGLGANGSSNSHVSAPFLHTTEQGGEIVGDLGTAAPPVLGEAELNELPDVELRI